MSGTILKVTITAFRVQGAVISAESLVWTALLLLVLLVLLVLILFVLVEFTALVPAKSPYGLQTLFLLV